MDQGVMKGVWGAVLAVCFSAQLGYSQQLDKIGSGDGVSLSGGAGATGNAYITDDENSIATPYTYIVSGNLALDLYGINIPVSFSYSNATLNHSGQPLNIIGLSPSYKNLTVHLGYRSMSFSTYTLAGHSFFGAGVEYSCKGFAVAAMGGRLLRAVEYDSTSTYVVPAYERWGEGMSLGYAKEGNSLKGIVFYAKDKPHSIEAVPFQYSITPQENLVYSLAVERRLNDIISLNAEGAMSAWTRDIRDSESLQKSSVRKKVFFMPERTSTQYYQAYKAGLNFHFELFQWGLGYERVEPGYHTLGAYSVTNDFENVTVNASTAFFQKKLSVSASIGLQHDDLDGEKMSRMNRTVGSLGLTYKASERLNLSGSFSGYNSYLKVKPIEEEYVENTVYDQLDTMNMIQVTQSYNGSADYKLFESDRILHQVFGSGGYQKADSEQGSNRFGNTMTNGTLGYSVMWKEPGINVGLNLNGSQSEYAQGESVYAGAGLSAGKSVWQRKLNISIGSNLSNNYQKGKRVAMLYSVYNSYSLRVAKQHSFFLNLRYGGRVQEQESDLGMYNKSINEYTGSVGYRYSFSAKPPKLKRD